MRTFAGKNLDMWDYTQARILLISLYFDDYYWLFGDIEPLTDSDIKDQQKKKSDKLKKKKQAQKQKKENEKKDKEKAEVQAKQKQQEEEAKSILIWIVYITFINVIG